MLTQACQLIPVNRRAGKRMANVFKIMKIVWDRNPFAHVDEDMKEALMVLFAMCIAKSKWCRLAMCELFSKIESQTNSEEWNTCLEELEQEARRNRIKLDPKVFEILSNVEWTDHFEDNLRLLRSFSFVGEYWESDATNEMDPGRQSESRSTPNDTDSAVNE